MSSWSEGYVADIGYTYGFYRELTPTILATVSLAKGQRSFDPNASLKYCELGCGQGFSTNLHAAANPHIEFYATDFNPSQIYGAKMLAADAGTSNVHFYDQAFADFINEPSLPGQFDIIALHGIYSWISEGNRRHIVNFIRDKLKPGGVVYISYNTLPGWAAVMPLRRLFVDQAATQSGPIVGRIESALQFVEKLKSVNASYFKANPGLGDRFDKVKGQPRSYLAHEYFNRDWTPFYHGDVVRELGDAKLDFVGSAALLEHIDAVNLTSDQQKIMAGIGDLTLRETMRDFMINQQFRRDVFSKGTLPLSARDSRAAWLDLRLALTAVRESAIMKITGPLGEVVLQPEVYGPILDGLSNGPRTVGQLLKEVPHLTELGWARIIQALGVLIGTSQVHPALNEKTDSKRSSSCRNFNRAVLQRAISGMDLTCLASPVTGGGLAVDRFAQLFLLAQMSKESDPIKFVWSLLKEQGQKLVVQGQPIEGEEANKAELEKNYEKFSKTIPLLKSLQIA